MYSLLLGSFFFFPKTQINQYIPVVFNSAHITPLIVMSLPLHLTSPPSSFLHPYPHYLFILDPSIHLSSFFPQNEMQVTLTVSSPTMAVLAGAAAKRVPVRSKSD
jgi:hypothetical protein